MIDLTLTEYAIITSIIPKADPERTRRSGPIVSLSCGLTTLWTSHLQLSSRCNLPPTPRDCSRHDSAIPYMTADHRVDPSLHDVQVLEDHFLPPASHLRPSEHLQHSICIGRPARDVVRTGSSLNVPMRAARKLLFGLNEI